MHVRFEVDLHLPVHYGCANNGVSTIASATVKEVGIFFPTPPYSQPVQEVDCQETSKDNPALSQRAASGVRQR